MGKASNLKAFQKAWDRQQLPVFHVIYADQSNNIFYSYNARVGQKLSLEKYLAHFVLCINFFG